MIRRRRFHTSPLDAWRAAACLVASRWHDFLAADGDTRPGAFAAYVAALDAEEAAAMELALMQLPEAA